MKDYKLNVARHNTKEDIINQLDEMNCFSAHMLAMLKNNDKVTLIANVAGILEQLSSLAD